MIRIQEKRCFGESSIIFKLIYVEFFVYSIDISKINDSW
jgi:hypothetical protein